MDMLKKVYSTRFYPDTPRALKYAKFLISSNDSEKKADGEYIIKSRNYFDPSRDSIRSRHWRNR